MFDYMHSPEGSWLMTYGVEGEAHTINAQGRPVVTDLLTNNPTGSFSAVSMKFLGRNSPFLTHPDEWIFLDYDGQQTVARNVWTSSANYDGIRPTYPLPAAETARVNRIMADINTYMNEMFSRFVMGQEPLANFPAYVQRIRSMGIDDALAAHNTAFARFRGSN
jgi:putative aldouronate transport system substrate-binding protein